MPELKALVETELRVLAERLQRYELDFRHRLAGRLRAVEDPGDPHGDAPYRRMSYTLDRLKAQREKVERELRRRTALTSNAVLV